MKRISARRASLLREVEPWRQKLKATGYCEWCCADRDGLEIHEICGGNGIRQLELGQPFSTVLLCRPCHSDLESMRKEHAVCIGLALIRYRRAEDYSLSKFYTLTDRNWPSEELVEHWWRRMLMGNS